MILFLQLRLFSTLTRSIVAHRPRRPVANTAHGIERQPFGARVLPSEQRAVFRFSTRYELVTRERVRETSHVQTLDVTVAVYAHLALERHPLFARVGRLFRFRVVGVLFARVVVQVLRRGRRPDSGRAHDQRRGGGPRRSSPQHERLSGRGRRRGGRGRRRLYRDRRERVVRPERQVGIRERLERTRLERGRLERRRLERSRLERRREVDGRRRRLLLRLSYRLPLCRLSYRLDVVERVFRVRHPRLEIIVFLRRLVDNALPRAVRRWPCNNDGSSISKQSDEQFNRDARYRVMYLEIILLFNLITMALLNS